ncbi:uncharacterized protein [Setaria viridis]|uniref:Uncharacterized protein n=1 Tax=Setaria viridis TaxID=4556 RepID=A0A4U6W6L1_SETVI|nr:hypothetical protein SEVIR_1G025233v2 [Setaria viridis]
MWENRQRCDSEDGPYWRAGPNNEYIRCYCTSMRNKVKPSWSNVPIEDAPSDSSDDIADVYDTVTRYGTQPERAPLNDYMGQQLARLSNEVGMVMERAVGSGDGLLRQFAERVRKSCKRMSMRMNCMSSSDVHYGGNGQGTSSGSRRTPLATPPRAVTPSTAAGPSWRSRGKAPASPQASEDSEGEQSEDDDPTYGEELEISVMIDAPPVTQTQGESSQEPTPRTRMPCQRRRSRDHTDVGCANVLPTHPRRSVAQEILLALRLSGGHDNECCMSQV